MSMSVMTDTLVLGYHAVSETWEADLSVTPRKLESQARALLRRGYLGATLGEATSTDRQGGKVASLTFDDGYRSVLRLAFPLLSALGIHATVFVAPDAVGAEQPVTWAGLERWLDGPHAQELIPMCWDELRELARHGWEIGSHSCSHSRLTSLGPDELRREVSESRERIEEEIGQPCISFCYPYGDLDERVVCAVERAGYKTACTSDRRPVGPMTVPRLRIHHDDNKVVFRMKTSVPMRRIRQSTIWQVVGPVKRMVRSVHPLS